MALEGQGSDSPSPPPTLGLQLNTTTPGFYMVAWDLNSEPHASMAGTLPPEPSSQLQQFDFNRFKIANVLYSNNDTKEIIPGPLLVMPYS